MKRLINILLIIALFCSLSYAQPDTILLSSVEYGNVVHQAKERITFTPNYQYTSDGSSMIAEIVQSSHIDGSISYNSVVNPSTRQLNTSYMTGSTGGGFNVNPAGQANYSIPLSVPPGVDGLAPSLSISYSSGGGSGVLGYGWRLGGVSAISRMPKNFYNDGARVGVDLTSSDRFALDGMRLVNTTLNYGDVGAQYRTENDIFSRVTSLETSGSGPGKFLAETKSGLKYEYGYTTDSKHKITGYNEVVDWYVSKISDLYGNQISYTYFTNNELTYLDEITYGPNTVTFYYKERVDTLSFYFMGVKMQQELLLYKVTMKYNGNTVKTYEFNYNNSSDNYNQYSMLNEVVEYGIGTSRLNSTVFSYQMPSAVSMSQTANNTTHSYISSQSKLYEGDFNGDGMADFFCLPDDGASWTGHKVYTSNGDDTFSEYCSDTTTINTEMMTAMWTMDLNADGLDDVVYEIFVDTETLDFSRLYYMLNDGSSLSSPVSFGLKEYLYEYDWNWKTRLYLKMFGDQQDEGADYNGDGINDVFYTNDVGSWIIKSFGNGYGQLSSSMTTRGSGLITTLADVPLSGDFNGDGKTDLWSFEGTLLRIYTFDGTDLDVLHYTYEMSDNYDFVMGDFNGDGKTDVLLYGHNGLDMTTWKMKLSTGDGFETILIPQKKSNMRNDDVEVGDFNGDGISDLVVSGSWTGTYIYVSKNQGNDFYSHYYSSPSECNVRDINGDGRSDIVTTTSTGYSVYKSSGNTQPLLEKIATGLNHLTTLSYTKLSQASSSVYQKGTGAVFPVMDLQNNLSVVSSVQVENGVGGTNTITYAYEGAKVHQQGKGLLCFSKMTKDDATAGITTESQFSYNTTYFYPKLTSVSKKLSGQSTAFEILTNTWSQVVLDATTKRIFPYVLTSTMTNSLTGHNVSTTTYYNTYGDPTYSTKSYNNGVTETTSNYYTNTVTSSDWLIGKLYQSSVSYSKSGESTITRTVSLTYYTDGILKPDFIKYYENTSLYRYINHDYDGNGNLTQVYEYGTGVGARQTNFTYEANGIRQKTVTDPMGHTTTNNYDTYGRLYTQVDYLSNTITYGYDNLGRVTSVTQPTGFVTTTSYNWGLTGGPSYSAYYIQQSGNDGSLGKAWFDELGREIRKETEGFSGTMIYNDTKYNTKGQIWKVSDPYFIYGEPVWATFSYDSYGRPYTITHPSGRNTSYSYSGSTVTSTVAGKSYSKTIAADGTLTSATDNSGTLNYTYYPDGNIKTITAPGSVVTSMQYDIAGNRTQLVDPSAGTITSTYDSFGQLKTQTNARNQTTTYNYYTDGRLYTKVTPEGTTTYAYNTNKQLTGISLPDNVSRGYGYDSKGRINNITETIPGSSSLSTSMTYDALGRLSTMTHPSGLTETNNYNSNGYYYATSLLGSNRYTITGMNARQQVTNATYGSSLNATYGFNTYGYPTSRATGSIQYDLYSFNSETGNLNNRSKYPTNTENFLYDSSDRLDSIYGNTNSLNGFDYDLKGNMTRKRDAGIMTFENASKPYAMTGLDVPSALYSDSAQVIDYTSFEKVSSIHQYPYDADFLYNADGNRCKMIVEQNNSAILTRWYSGSRYIKETAGSTTKEYTFIGGDAYTAPVLAVKDSEGTSVYYLLRDHLGSITHVVSGTYVIEEHSFDAWGRMRNPSTWAAYAPGSEPNIMAGRGFTGHEHLPWFNLINMNGRMYDPMMGAFLSPDLVVQNPASAKNYNRYSYVMNNPLKFSDPNGYIYMALEQPSFVRERTSFTNNSFLGNIYGGGGSFTPHIDRAIQQCIAQDAAGGWRYDEKTGRFYNLFSNEKRDASEAARIANEVGGKDVVNFYVVDYFRVSAEGLTGSSQPGVPGTNDASSPISFDPKTGGFINSFSDFITFMYDQAKNNPVEVAAFVLQDGMCYVQPWDLNSAIQCVNNVDGIPGGYTRGDILAQYHTHPNSSGPSYLDALFSASYGKPVYTMGANGNMWLVSYSIGQMVPIYGKTVNGKYYGIAYGTIID